MRDISLKELVSWTIKNRSKTAFKDYSHNKIAEEIKASIKCKGFTFKCNNKEEIIGIVCCERYDDHTVIVHDVIATQPGIIKEFMKVFLTRFPNHKIIGECRNRPRIFNDPTKLERRLK